MELSVDARVKAHISTAYIDADGRGTEGAYSSEFADCMKSPAEYAEIVRGHSKDEELLQQMESDHLAAIKKFEDFKATVDHRENKRCLSRAEEAAALTEAHVTQREIQRGKDRDTDAIALDQAYHKRNTDEDSMRKFQDMSRRTLAAEVRDREEGVRSRYQQLKDKAATAKKLQRQTIEEHQQRTIESERKREQELEEKLRLLQEREDAEQKLRAREEFQRIKMHREREARKQREEEEIARAAEVELRQYEIAHADAIEEEKRATALRVEKEKEAHDIAIRQSQEQTEADYTRLKSLQIEMETNANDIRDNLSKNIGAGSHLSILMTAAKSRADETQTAFIGLSLLSQATFLPSALTPPAAPVPDGVREKTVSCQTLISEPIRSTKQKRL